MTVSGGGLVWDCVVFAAFILMSTCWPLWSKLSKPATKADFVFAASGGVGVFSMMMSIARGTLGVRSFLGFPSELYYRGSAMWETVYGMVCAYPIVMLVFVPVYYTLGITSVYQYLDLRFKSRLVRCLASATFIWRQLLGLGITVFTPCVALNTVIGIPYWASIVGIILISIFFTLLGGLKAAIKADMIQGVTMILICVAIIVQGVVMEVGPGSVIADNYNSGRLQFFQFKWDVRTRVDTMSAWLGQLFMSLSQFGCQQNFVQRYCSMSSERKVQRTLLLNIPMVVVLFSLSWVVGMVIYSVYQHCDPMSAGYTRKMDEILPFFVEDQFMYIPGLMGLFMGSLFNGALSILVSNLNSLATVTWEDFVSQTPLFRDVKDKQELIIIKIIGGIYALIIMGVSFAVGLLSGVVEGGMLVMSATSGPLLGVFLLAMLVPCANRKGAATGMIASHVVTSWMTAGHLLYGMDTAAPHTLPLSVEGCTNRTFSPSIARPVSLHSNLTVWSQHQPHNLTQHDDLSHSSPSIFYLISYMYYAFIGTVVCVGVGVAVSLLCGSDDTDLYDEKLLHPAVLKLSRMMPGEPRKFLNQLKEKDLKDFAGDRNNADEKLETGLAKVNLAFNKDEDLDVNTKNGGLGNDTEVEVNRADPTDDAVSSNKSDCGGKFQIRNGKQDSGEHLRT